jgi:hypothetical protein
MPTFTRFRTNLDNFDRKNIVVNHVGIAETGNVVGERIGGRSGLIVNISPPANIRTGIRYCSYPVQKQLRINSLNNYASAGPTWAAAEQRKKAEEKTNVDRALRWLLDGRIAGAGDSARRRPGCFHP